MRDAKEHTLAELFLFPGVLKVTFREEGARGWNVCRCLASPAGPSLAPQASDAAPAHRSLTEGEAQRGSVSNSAFDIWMPFPFP